MEKSQMNLNADFVRQYAEKTYGIPPEQVVGTAGGTTFGYDKAGKPFLTNCNATFDLGSAETHSL